MKIEHSVCGPQVRVFSSLSLERSGDYRTSSCLLFLLLAPDACAQQSQGELQDEATSLPAKKNSLSLSLLFIAVGVWEAESREKEILTPAHQNTGEKSGRHLLSRWV